MASLGPLLGDFEALSFHPPGAGLGSPASGGWGLEGGGSSSGGTPEATWGGSQAPVQPCQSAAELTLSPWDQREAGPSPTRTEPAELTGLTLRGQKTPSRHWEDVGITHLQGQTPAALASTSSLGDPPGPPCLGAKGVCRPTDAHLCSPVASGSQPLLHPEKPWGSRGQWCALLLCNTSPRL